MLNDEVYGWAGSALNAEETFANQLNEVRRKLRNLTRPFLRARDSFAARPRHTFCDYDLAS